VTSAEQIKNWVLQEGLEDLIPLPEIVQTVQTRELVRDEHVVREVAEVLTSLLHDGRIQIWSGHWSEEATFVPRPAADDLLANPEQYEFNSPSDLERRVYFVNVDNLRVDEEP
jgi:hypothetical protein